MGDRIRSEHSPQVQVGSRGSRDGTLVIQRAQARERRQGKNPVVLRLLPEILNPVIGVILDARASEQQRGGVNQDLHVVTHEELNMDSAVKDRISR